MTRHPKYNRGNLYLSGGMEYAKDLGGQWRGTLGPLLKELGYYPLDITKLDKSYTEKHGVVKYNDFGQGIEGEMLRKANIRKHFIETDLNLIKYETDALIVYYDESVRRGAGTISECQYAYLLDIPVFIMSAYQNWHSEVPGWLHGLSTKIFTNWDNLLGYLGDLPPGILKRDRYGNHSSEDQYLCSLSGEPFQKSKHHFVSKVSPLYSKDSVKVVKQVNEEMTCRYQFFIETIAHDIENDN